MTREPVLVRDDLGVDSLVDLFRERGLSRAPVVNAEGRLVGIVSKTDLVEDSHLREDTGEVDQTGAEFGQHVHAGGPLVRDVMSPVVYVLPATTTLLEAARRMLATNIHAVPVTSDGDGRVVGILSTTDVMAWVAGPE